MSFRDHLASVGISQSDLSRITGINLRQIQRLCLGEAKLENITAQNYLRICQALGKDPASFLGEVTNEARSGL